MKNETIETYYGYEKIFTKKEALKLLADKVSLINKIFRMKYPNMKHPYKETGIPKEDIIIINTKYKLVHDITMITKM